MKVYQFGLLRPSLNETLVRQQLRAAHEYRNDLVAIERGRRGAIRAIDKASEAVREAEAALRAATKTDRMVRMRALSLARKEARAVAFEEMDRISDVDESFRRNLRAHTLCFWGTYLDIEAAHQQSRSQPMYGDDGVTPNDPAFARGPRWREALADDDPRRVWWLAPGQVCVQIQKGMVTTEALACTDRRVQLELGPPGKRGRRFGKLRLRVGSDGREPVWAEWPIKTHRDVPATATWKWVRVSLRTEGLHEKWTVEITVDEAAANLPDTRPATGAMAVEWEWSALDVGGIRVARWCDDRGAEGEVVLPAGIAVGIAKPNGIRAVRDLILNEMRERVVTEIRQDASAPDFVRAALPTMHLWKSHQRFRALVMHWRRAVKFRKGGPTDPKMVSMAFASLDAWERRDAHLYDYESGARGEALRERREFYRCLAAKWRRQYAVVLLSDQDLSREARWGDDGDTRFVAGVSEMRLCLRHAFGEDAIDSRWRDQPDATDERLWCVRTRDAWIAGGARGDGRFAAVKTKTVNAWAARKAKAKRTETEGSASPERS